VGVAVPVLLWCGATGAGLALAWALALALGSVTTAFDLSCLLVASLPFWVPPHHILALRWMTLAPAARSCGLLAATALLGSLLVQRPSRVHGRLHFMSLIWLLAANPLQYAVAAVPPPAEALGCEWGAAPPVFGSTLRQVGVVTLVLAALNGACPYLGLKTQSTWSLFSNLHVEGGVSNHLLLPASLQPFGYASDCVTVTRTNVPALKERHAVAGGAAELQLFRGFAERMGVETLVHSVVGRGAERGALPYDIPYFQLRCVVALNAMPLLQEFFVEYQHCGATRRFEARAGLPGHGNDEGLARPPAALLRGLLAFRAVPPGARGPVTTS